MLKAMSNNTLMDKRNIVFVRGNEIVRKFGTSELSRENILRTLPRSDIAQQVMAHVWSVAVSRGGISMGNALVEIRNVGRL